MSKLPRISAQELIKALKKMGFQEIRQRGSHLILAKETAGEKVGCVVPMHSEIATGTLIEILKQAKITKDELNGHL
jgi:predicted RNA binding protein YcfA (HicA-like mRNA interferase family)